jgi:hypothetical protein
VPVVVEAEILIDLSPPPRLPDARFLEYARRRYGIEHVISLVGSSEIHEKAKELGMNVTILDWRTLERPVGDLKILLRLFDRGEVVLLHCKAGRDRSGYAIAIYRIQRQHWRIDAPCRRWKHMVIHGIIIGKPSACCANRAVN